MVRCTPVADTRRHTLSKTQCSAMRDHAPVDPSSSAGFHLRIHGTIVITKNVDQGGYVTVTATADMSNSWCALANARLYFVLRRFALRNTKNKEYTSA